MVGYYKLVFSLIAHQKMTLTEIENMMPYEMEIYTDLLIQHLKDIKDANTDT